MGARPETVEWLERYYQLLDDGRVREAIAEYFAPAGCTFRSGNNPATDFLDEARRMSRLVTSTTHTVEHVLESSDGTHVAAELTITYTRRDGSMITLPGALFARRDHEGRFAEQRAYADLAPLQV